MRGLSSRHSPQARTDPMGEWIARGRPGFACAGSSVSEWEGGVPLGKKKKEAEKEWKGTFVFSPYPLTDLFGRLINDGAMAWRGWKIINDGIERMS